MKSYLDLVPAMAKEHRKQNRMTIFCIVLSVFLVTTIFGMADMYIRSQRIQAQRDFGNWHINVRNISDEQADIIAARKDVKAVSCYGILNYRGEDGYTLGGKSVAIMGSEESFLTQIIENAIAEGSFPIENDEAMLSLNAQQALDIAIGDSISVLFPNGSAHQFKITGFINSTANLMSEDSYGISMTTAGYRALYPAAVGSSPADYNSTFYVQFVGNMGIQSKIADLKAQLSLSDDQVSENTKLMALLGQGSNAFSVKIYSTAAVLFVLVLIAGIMMIASSLSSSVAGRTQFFGMVRCIGATKKQVKKLVRREALNWCFMALPMGVGTGVVLIWLLCLLLRLLSPDYFSTLPVFGVSIPSILAGCILGLMTVFFAANAPAKHAARVSPLAAVSGGMESAFLGKAANTSHMSIDVVLGIQHAKQSRKNYLLMSGSFALSVILFLSFAVSVDFMKHALTPMYPWTPDLTVSTQDNGALIAPALLDRIREYPAVERAYGRMAANSVPAVIGGKKGAVHLISYEEEQFAWAEKYLLSGRISDVQTQAGTGLVVYDSKNPITLGSTIKLNASATAEELTVAGVLSTSPFRAGDNGVIVICSEDTLRQIAGVNEYAVVDIQLFDAASDMDVDNIRSSVGAGYSFADERLSNSSVRGAYYSFALFIYGFLALIALVTIFNIVNSMAMSVGAHTKQYGILRAVGLSGKQLSRMITTEAVTYSLTGSFIGTAVGLALNYLLFSMIISFNWGDAWRFPLIELVIILAVIALSVFAAVRSPIRRIMRTSIVNAIGAQ